MALIADTGPLVVLYDRGDRHHRAVRRVLEREPGAILIPAPVLTEVDYLLRKFLGVDAALDFLAGLWDGSLTHEPLTPSDMERCAEVMAEYRESDIGLADASILAVAERREIYRILTLDQRDFRLLRPRGGKALVLLPGDE
jgi:uncharacterized protein